MIETEAREIALQYALKNIEVLPGFKNEIGDTEEFTNKYYFDLRLVPLDGDIKEDISFGGARGLVVDKNNSEIEIMTHSDYYMLSERENELARIHQFLLGFKNEKKKLTDIKTILDLSSKQLLQLSNFVKNMEFKKEKTYEIVSKLLEEIKYAKNHK